MNKELIEFINCDFSSKLELVASKDISIDLLSEIIDYYLNIKNNYIILFYVSRNININITHLNKLVLSDNPDIRANVAAHKKISYDLMCKLCDDESIKVKRCLSNNKNTESSILEKLSLIDDLIIKRNISLHNNANAQTLLNIYYDYKRNVIKHPNCPDFLKILEK